MNVTLTDIVALCKRRGFLFLSSSLYGGVQGLYDYGPLGVELKNALKKSWWTEYVYRRDDIIGLDSAILSHPLTFHYSGHDSTFSDSFIDCLQCQHRFRTDHLTQQRCEHCGGTAFTEPKSFNLMLKTTLGTKDQAYLRPETAQGIFTNFKNISETSSKSLPFGIAQIGKAFRNEITPRHFIFRIREFEQMEIEFFVRPREEKQWYAQWIQWRYHWWLRQGLSKEKLRLVEQKEEELAHYAKATTDIQYQFPHGFEELEGIASRTDYDLGSHSKNQKDLNLHAKVQKNNHATQKLAFFDSKNCTWQVPFVIEPSAGVDRGVFAILTDAYHQETVNDVTRIVLKLKPHLAPVKVAVIPLVRNNTPLIEMAKQLIKCIRALNIGIIAFENSGNIGKNYRKHDEIGTPFCVTVDFDSLSPTHQRFEDTTVTLRERDSMQQERLTIQTLLTQLQKYFELPFS